jgi:hypothetical protein
MFPTYTEMKQCIGDLQHTCDASKVERILLLEATKIITSYNQHIERNYEKYLRQFVNKTLRAYLNIDNNSKNRKQRKKDLHELKNLIVKGEQMSNRLSSIETIYTWWQLHRNNIIPFETILEFQHNGESFLDTLQQLLCSTPHIYLKSLFYMANYLEVNQLKSINLFPQRSSQIACHVQIDTASMLELLIDRGVSQYLRSPSSEEAREKWNHYFDFSKVKRINPKKK